MFEGLNQINWKNVGYHIWGNDSEYLEEIPQKIRDLISPNQEKREFAIEHVLGEKGTFGIICDTTPYILPFIIKLIDNPETPERFILADYLLRVMDNLLATDNISITEMRLYLHVYDSISGNLHTLLKLMNDDDYNIQISAIETLGKLTSHAESLLTELFNQLNLNENENRQVEILKSIKRLLSSLDPWKQVKTKEKFALALRDIVNNAQSLKIKIAAASASVETFILNRRDKMIISELVPELLSQEFSKRHFNHQFSNFYWKGQLDYSISLIRDLARIGNEPLLSLLQNPELDAIQSQLVVRGLFASILLNRDENVYWNSNMSHTDIGLFYLPVNRTGDYRVFITNKDNTFFFKQILETVIENSKVWEMPTNMFSFFFGLPDSKEGLQKVLNNIV
jgi:hypothetical protein